MSTPTETQGAWGGQGNNLLAVTYGGMTQVRGQEKVPPSLAATGSDRDMEALYSDQSGALEERCESQGQANLSWIRGRNSRCGIEGFPCPAEGGEERSSCLSGGCHRDRDPGWAVHRSKNMGWANMETWAWYLGGQSGWFRPPVFDA